MAQGVMVAACAKWEAFRCTETWTAFKRRVWIPRELNGSVVSKDFRCFGRQLRVATPICVQYQQNQPYLPNEFPMNGLLFATGHVSPKAHGGYSSRRSDSDEGHLISSTDWSLYAHSHGRASNLVPEAAWLSGGGKRTVELAFPRHVVRVSVHLSGMQLHINFLLLPSSTDRTFDRRNVSASPPVPWNIQRACFAEAEET